MVVLGGNPWSSWPEPTGTGPYQLSYTTLHYGCMWHCNYPDKKSKLLLALYCLPACNEASTAKCFLSTIRFLQGLYGGGVALSARCGEAREPRLAPGLLPLVKVGGGGGGRVPRSSPHPAPGHSQAAATAKHPHFTSSICARIPITRARPGRQGSWLAPSYSPFFPGTEDSS